MLHLPVYLKLQGGKNFLVPRDAKPLLVPGGEDYEEKLDGHSHVSLNVENLSMLAQVLSGASIVT